jgi:hypothetical protein
MNTRKLQAISFVAASLVAGSAFADGAEYEYPQPVHSTLKRSDVRAEAIAAVHSGAVASDEYKANQYPKADVIAASKLLREQVVAEAIAARRLGLIAEGDLAQPVPTAAQAEQIRLAGQAAVARHLAAGKMPKAQ